MVAELLTDGGPELATWLADFFCEVLHSGKAPDSWKKNLFKMLHKGEEQEVGNYRPISLLLMIYKVFSNVMLQKLVDCLVEAQPVGQAGFRRGFPTLDHILWSLHLVTERGQEYEVEGWVVAVDFRKAFDTVRYSSIMAAAEDQGADPVFLRVLSDLMAGQTGQVIGKEESKDFHIRGSTCQ